MESSTTGKREIRRARQSDSAQRYRLKPDTLVGYLLVAPAMLLVLAVMVYPTLFNLTIAIQEWSWSTPAGAEKPFVGLANFLQLFNSSRFWNSVGISLLLVVGGVVVRYVLGLGLALLLNRHFRSSLKDS